MRYLLPVLLPFAAAVVLALSVGSARAGDVRPAITYTGTGGAVAGGLVTQAAPSDFTRLIQQNVSNGGIDITDTARARAGQTDFDMLLKRNVTRKAVEKAGAALLRTLPVVGTGITLWDIWDEVRVRPTAGAGLGFDEGTATTTVTKTCYRGYTGTPAYPSQAPNCLTSAAAAATADLNERATCTRGYCNTANTQYRAGAIVTLSPTLFRMDMEARTCNTTTGVCGAWGTNGDRFELSPTAQSSTVTECPASIDASNPANSIPAGQPVGFDGKCRTGRYTTPLTDDQAADKRILGPVAKVLPQFLDELARGGAPQPDGSPAQGTTPDGLPGVLSGPGTVAQPGTVTTTSPGGVTTTSPAPSWSITYGGSNSWTWNTTTTTINNDGSTTTTTAPPEVKTCGLPNTPACKIDETGTPTWTQPQDPTPGLKADDAAKRDAAAASIVDPQFGWFSAPPIVQCTPFDWPGGVQIDPCPQMGVARDIMAYLWALFGAWWSFGVIRKAITGG